MERHETRMKRRRAANRYQPDQVKLLLVGEAPPSDPSRYFYFEDVTKQDSLYRYVVRGVLDMEPTRQDKPRLLKRLSDEGVFLIDLKEDPLLQGEDLDQWVSDLVRRVREFDPSAIVLIKTTVYDAAYSALSEAGLPVVDERIPFPGSGRQREFEAAFARAHAAATNA